MQEIEVWPGDRITVVAQKAVESAHFTGEDACFTFNDTRAIVNSGQNIDDVVRGYWIARGDDPDEHGTFVITL